MSSMRQDAQSNRERDDRVDVALGLYQGVMAYDLEVRFEGERTGLQKDHMVRMIAGLELDRAAKISDKTSKICGNAAFEEASTMITDTRWNRPCGIRLRSFFAGDLSDSPWDGQQELAGLETDDDLIGSSSHISGRRILLLGVGEHVSTLFVVGRTRCCMIKCSCSAGKIESGFC